MIHLLSLLIAGFLLLYILPVALVLAAGVAYFVLGVALACIGEVIEFSAEFFEGGKEALEQLGLSGRKVLAAVGLAVAGLFAFWFFLAILGR